jgi:hypothetical protein
VVIHTIETVSLTATRSCSIPEGQWLFFPVVNCVNINTPNCGRNGINVTADQLRSQIVAIVD